LDLLLETVTASCRTCRCPAGTDLICCALCVPKPSPARAIPAAVLSAYLASEHAAAAAGFQLFIEKPVQPLELVGQIAQLAGRTAIH
jgi:CheY-like chemotaxis protein